MATEDLQSKAADLIRRVLTVGVGAAFLTEESVRNLVTDIKIPKELLGGILESANKTKADFLQRLSSDLLDRVLEHVDARALVDEVLRKNDIELTVKVSFRPKKG